LALTATIYHFEIDVSDVDRGFYQVLDLRLAQHPSESMRYMLTRTIAYSLFYEEGIAFSKGLSTSEEPALWVKDLQGNVTLWIEVGSPSPERLHKASKAAPRVVVVTQHDPEVQKRQLRGKGIHRESEIEIYALAPAFLDAIETKIDRHVRWELVRNEGELYVTIAGQSFSGTWQRHAIGD
jgi:uncharacterized protein YaeQ